MASSFDKLPADLLSRVLQLLPAKELCRLRAVCRSWRSLTSDAAFVKAHAERHKETLFVAKFLLDDVNSGVVVDGVVYFFTLPAYYPPVDDILSFDLAREEWRRVLHGPLSTGNVPSAEKVHQSQLTLCDLKGSLVLAYPCGHLSTLDLWFLLDFESGLWAKKYSIRTESVPAGLANINQIILPLLVLHDGRLVIYIATTGPLFICDPGTNTFTRVHTRDRLASVGVYTGSLLAVESTRGSHGVVLS